MELHHERLFDVKERNARKWIVALLVVVIAVGFPAVWLGPRIHSQWQQGRLMRKARESLARNEVSEAAILLRRVLGFDADNVEATRAMADLAEKFLPNEAPGLRERVCQLAPGSYEDAKAWTLAALRLGQNAQAEDAFELMNKLGSRTSAHEEIGARIALAAGRWADARAGFGRALALDPGNDQNRLQLAAIDIRSPELADQERAQTTLESFRANPALRHSALRALIGDRLDHGDVVGALLLGKNFVGDPETTFQDRVQYLGVLRASEAPSGAFLSSFQGPGGLSLEMQEKPAETSFTSYLSELESEARDAPAKAAALITFLNSQGLALLASAWAGSLPSEMQSTPPVAIPLAEAYRLTVNWSRLEAFVTEGNWDAFDFVRAAYFALVLQGKGDRAGAASQWAAAVRLAEYRPERLAALERMAAAWNWVSEWEDLAWLVARSSKHPRQALEGLADFYRPKRDTQKLFAVWSLLLELDPEDVPARMNWARLSVLLGSDKYRSRTMAQELYRLHPEIPEIVCTYALVQHFRELDDEALAIMEKLSPEQLRSPPVAGYYGIILLAKNRKDEAADFLNRALEAPLLPEEIELMNETRRALRLSTQRR